MTNILSWKTVNSNAWSYHHENRHCKCIVYKLTGLPDFTEHRFDYLCKEADGRQAEVVKKQISMIRQLHGLGEACAISLRIKKEQQSLVLYLVFRYAGTNMPTDQQLAELDARIKNALMTNEYSFQRVADEDAFSTILEAPWATEIAQITKTESEYKSDIYPDNTWQDFYVPYAWTAADNSMEQICSALMNHPGTAVAEVTIVPTQYLEAERQWLNVSISRLKDCMNGETFKSSEGRILWQGRKLPVLKPPLDNCEKMNKQYESSRLFLTSIRVFADSGAEVLANAFLVNSVKNEAPIQLFKKGYGKFNYVLDCYRNVDISADAHPAYWNRHADDAPYRAQRLAHLCSAEEISNFFRIPVPIKPGFYGFAFDSGLGVSSNKRKPGGDILLGKYLDDGKEDSPASFSVQHLAKHGLLVGVPGSGKTTAMFNILDQLWNVPDDQKIPFIVLEPAKTEYRALLTLPEFKDDMLVFSLGDESVSPFRFNPLEVLPGIPLELHMSRLQSCFIGAFDLFDPLPVFLEQAIRRTYEEKGWYSDSVGGEPGVETPTLADLCRNAEYVVAHSGFDERMASNFKTSLLERLNSLRRGSKGRMLDTRHSIPMKDLMERPVILELDSLNGSEKTLLMMFLLTYVFEYCKIKRKSGSPLKHMLLVEEAHNLIGASGTSSESRADPKAQTIELFVNMLAEMRALGQGILIADQLPTAIASQAVKQTNVKIMMRVTARDDREEMGNTMDLNEDQMHQVVNFKTGHAYVYHEGEDRVRKLRMVNFKDDHDVEEPPSNDELRVLMGDYERCHREIFLPFSQCLSSCTFCDKRVRSQAESFVTKILLTRGTDPYTQLFSVDVDKQREALPLCSVCLLLAKREAERIKARYGSIGESFGRCVYIHMLNLAQSKLSQCTRNKKKSCGCDAATYSEYIKKYDKIGKE